MTTASKTPKTSTFKVLWEDPPLTRGAGSAGKWTEIMAPLRANPNKWANLGDKYSSATASNIRKGLLMGIEPGEFEVTIRRSGDKVTLYARYVGTDRNETT